MATSMREGLDETQDSRQFRAPVVARARGRRCNDAPARPDEILK
jgi:hypothetical protein